MSKDLREAIRNELLALDGLGDAEAPAAREVLSRLWAQATVEIFERGDRARFLAATISRGQHASLTACAASGGAVTEHLSPEFISGVILNADIL